MCLCVRVYFFSIFFFFFLYFTRGREETIQRCRRVPDKKIEINQITKLTKRERSVELIQPRVRSTEDDVPRRSTTDGCDYRARYNLSIILPSSHPQWDNQRSC